MERSKPHLHDALKGVHLAEDADAEADDALAMPLKEFAESRLLIEVYSRALGERVLFAGDLAQADRERCRDLTLFRGSELIELFGVNAPDLREIHKAKKVIAWSLFA